MRINMHKNTDLLEFTSREEFRCWLKMNHKQENGIWILFAKGNKQFSASDALEEAICFGWIDGLMKSIDAKAYKKYFSKRKDMTNWSDKNITIYERLVNIGLMTKAGNEVYKAEKKVKQNVVDMSERIKILRDVLKDNKEILTLFDNKAPSRQKQFAGFYCEAKTAETRNKRKNKIIEALENNYTGMLY
jgi:uncharacterized protein YdeI (YjbR/CyaY-like superfamily)